MEFFQIQGWIYEDATVFNEFATCEEDSRWLGMGKGKHHLDGWEKEPATICACYFIWRQKFTLKVWVSVWLLFRQRLVLCALW